MRRLLDRLSHTPVVVYDASWTLVLANAPYDALMGDTTTWSGLERNAVWRNVTRLPTRSCTRSRNTRSTRRGSWPTSG